MTDRMILKKQLKFIAKSDIKIDTEIYNFFMDNLHKIGFTDREIVFLIYDLLSGYIYEKEDLEIAIANILFNETTIKNHAKFNELFIESYICNCNDIFQLLIKHNVIIEPEVIEFAEYHFENIQYDIFYYIEEEIDETKNMLNTLKLNFRKQKIENIRNRTKIRLINDKILNPLLSGRTTGN